VPARAVVNAADFWKSASYWPKADNYLPVLINKRIFKKYTKQYLNLNINQQQRTRTFKFFLAGNSRHALRAEFRKNTGIFRRRVGFCSFSAKCFRY
jgi:hypothetical protein